MTRVEALAKLHAEIMAAAREYRPPWALLRLLDAEYQGYVRNTSPGSLYYQWLALAVRLTKPTLVVELGSGLGVSTLLILAELSETARLVTCDVAPRLRFVPPEIMRDPRLQFCSGNDLDLNVFGDDLPVGVDLLFVDTEHSFDQVSAEWRIYRHLCHPGALVVLDDILMNDMPRFWDALPYPKLDLTTECHRSGFGIFRYQSDEAPSPSRAYREALHVAWKRLDRAAAPGGDRPALWRRAARALGLTR